MSFELCKVSFCWWEGKGCYWLWQRPARHFCFSLRPFTGFNAMEVPTWWGGSPDTLCMYSERCLSQWTWKPGIASKNWHVLQKTKAALDQFSPVCSVWLACKIEASRWRSWNGAWQVIFMGCNCEKLWVWFICLPVGTSDGTRCLKHLCAGGKRDTRPTEESVGTAAWGEAGYNLSSLGVGCWIELLISQQHLQSSNFRVFFSLTKSPNAVIVHSSLTLPLRKARHRKGK